MEHIVSLGGREHLREDVEPLCESGGGGDVSGASMGFVDAGYVDP